ncbi:DUF3048 C-terminal domain-containing protein [Haloimpatiens sp. FM7315]|uniref:DUF3048 C-terminal domain-containing protein n=1 Tax=Haloimpatiens sp. FM7315 TaxID=3298609 RepID=UPI0035A290E6
MKKTYILNGIITFLSIILCILIASICYNLIHLNKFSNIKISPYTGEIIKNKTPIKNSVEVIFKINEDNYTLDGLSSANIIIEYINSSNKPLYRAIYYDKKPELKNKVSILSDEKNSFSMPKFNFIDLPDISEEYIKEVNNIFISFNDYHCSNFIYKDGQYYHYKSSHEDLDKSSNKPLCVSNVIVQFKDNTNGSNLYGNGLLFCGGKVIDIKWHSNEGIPIKITDKNGKDISLVRGNTWWVILDNYGNIAYN